MPPPKRSSSSSISSNTGDALSDEDYGAFKANPNRTLFFRDLPFHYRDSNLRSMVLALLGAHEADPRYHHLLCRVKYSKEDGKTLQIGLVQFNSTAEVDLVLSALVSNKRFDGRDVSAFPFSVNSGNRPSKDGSIQFSFKCDSDEPLITEGLVRQYLEAKYGLLKSISIRGHFSLMPAGQDGFGFMSFESTDKDMSFLRSTSRVVFDRDGFRLVVTFRQVISKQTGDTQVASSRTSQSSTHFGEQSAPAPTYKAEISQASEQQLPASYHLNHLPQKTDYPVASGDSQSHGQRGFPAPPQLSVVIPPYPHAQYVSNTLQQIPNSTYGHPQPQPTLAPVQQQDAVYPPQLPSSATSTAWASHVPPNPQANAQYHAVPSVHHNGQYVYPAPIMTASSSSSSFGEPIVAQPVLYGEPLNVPSPTNFSVWSSSSSSPASSTRQYIPAAAPVLYYNYSPRNLPGPQVHQYASHPPPPPPSSSSSSQHIMPPSSNNFYGSSPRSGPQVFHYVAAAPPQHILPASTQNYQMVRTSFTYPSHPPHFAAPMNMEDPYSSIGAGQPINRNT